MMHAKQLLQRLRELEEENQQYRKKEAFGRFTAVFAGCFETAHQQSCCADVLAMLARRFESRFACLEEAGPQQESRFHAWPEAIPIERSELAQVLRLRRGVIDNQAPMRWMGCPIPTPGGPAGALYVAGKSSAYTTEALLELKAVAAALAGPIALSTRAQECERLRAELHRLQQSLTRSQRIEQECARWLESRLELLRGPILSVIALAEMLRTARIPPKLAAYVEAIQRASQAVREGACTLVVGGDPPQRLLPETAICCDLFALVEECIADLRPEAGAKGLELILRAHRLEPRQVYCEPVLVRHILQELALYAIRSAASGQIEVEAGIVHLGEADCYGQFTFISRSHQPAGFDEPAPPMAMLLAEAMQGHIEACWDPEAGWRACWTVCLRAASEPGSVDSTRKQLAEEPFHSLPRVLVAEDSRVNQRLIKALLERLGCTVDVAANGRLAVEMARQHDYDLVFMDCQMPELDGYQAALQIRRLQGRNGRAPIIALTADATEVNARQCQAAGMDDFLVKPVTPAGIKQVVLKWLAVRAAPDLATFRQARASE